MASRGRGANRTAGRSGPRPPGFYAWCGQSLQAPVPLPGAGFVGPHPKTATVERREGSRSPRDRVVARRRRDRGQRVHLSALHPPLIGGGRNCCCRDGRWRQSPRGARRRTRKRRHVRRDGQTRAQQRAAGTNNTALFDIVNMTTANGSLRAPRLRTRRACAHSRVPAERASASEAPGPRGRRQIDGQTCRRVALGSRSLASLVRDTRSTPALIPPAGGRAACASWRRSCARRTPRHRRFGWLPAGCADRSGETGRPGHRCRRSTSSAA